MDACSQVAQKYVSMAAFSKGNEVCPRCTEHFLQASQTEASPRTAQVFVRQSL